MFPTLLISLFSITSAYAQSALPDLQDEELERIFGNDGLYVYDVAEPTVKVRRIGAITWEFDRAARYAVPSEYAHAWEPILTVRTPEGERARASRDAADLILGTVRYDSNGHRWVAIDVDEQALAREAEVQQSLRQLERDFDLENDLNNDIVESQEAVDMEEWWTPTSWTNHSCAGGVRHTWNSWSRSSAFFSNPNFYAVEKSAVRTYLRDNNNNYQELCNGTVVGPSKVLTAAHCQRVPSNINLNYGAALLAVCTRGNMTTGSRCYTVAAYDENPQFSGSPTDWRDDYTVLHVNGLIKAPTMYLATTSDNTYEARPSHLISHGVYNQSNFTSCNSGGAVGTNPTYPGGWMQRQSSDIVSTPTGGIGTRHDVGPGDSGAGIYYCTNGSLYPSQCSGARLTGVLSGFGGTGWWNWYARGPKARDIKGWVDAQTN